MNDAYVYGGCTIDLILDFMPGVHLVSRVATHKSQRRRGHADKLLSMVVSQAKDEGVRLALDVCPDDPKDLEWLSEFYESHGFRWVGYDEFEELHPMCMIME